MLITTTKTLRGTTEEEIEIEGEEMDSKIKTEAMVAKDTRIESGSIKETQILRLLLKCGLLA